MVEKLKRLESDRERTSAEIREANSLAIHEASAGVEKALHIKMMGARDRTATDVNVKIEEFRNHIASNHQIMLNAVESTVERVVSVRLVKRGD